MTVPRKMRFPDDFDALLQSRVLELRATPAQYVRAMYRTLERLGALHELPADVVQVLAEAKIGQSFGGQKGGRKSKRRGQPRPMAKT